MYNNALNKEYSSPDPHYHSLTSKRSKSYNKISLKIYKRRSKWLFANYDTAMIPHSTRLDTMYHEENGAGLAASQIGIMKQLVVIDMGQGLIQLVNPKIMETYGARECMEGCLSYPGLVGKTIRPKKVKVKALNEQGEPLELWGEDDFAMCLCHEIDHLDGIVYLDRATELYRVVGEKE